jgi:dienelactone hydrolase
MNYSFAGEVIPEKKIEEAFADPDPEKKKMQLLDLPGFLGRHSKEIRSPEIFACVKTLKAEYKKVGAIGYCWGGWACFRLAAKGNNLLDCVSVAHPSRLEKSEIDVLGVPTQILAPETDQQLTPELKE